MWRVQMRYEARRYDIRWVGEFRCLSALLVEACPGTHMEPDAQRKNKGFARIGKKDYPRYEKLKQNICVRCGTYDGSGYFYLPNQ